MKKSISILAVLIIVVGALVAGYFWPQAVDDPADPTLNGDNGDTVDNGDMPPAAMPDISIIAEGLSIPWDIAFLPDGAMLVTERTGDVLLFANGLRETISIPQVEHIGEGGLLGIALHPEFETNRYVYLYHTMRSGDGLINRVVRYTFDDNTLRNPETIISDIPGARFHDGGRIVFGPDGYLYITTGDAGVVRLSQERDSLAGKILRIGDDGSIPTDNPFDNAVYSYGHRNPQGIAWDGAGRLWSTEHGPSGPPPNCCQDELNLIVAGENYGWPDSVGDTVLPGTVAPAIHSGMDTWAPASAAYWDGSVFFGGLRAETLYEAVLDGERVVELREHFSGEFGRIRTVVIAPDGMMYLTTSNRDGRGSARQGDDKIIRINPEQFRR